MLLIHIGTINAMEYTRINYNNIQGMQNSHIAVLHHLADPLVNIVYIVHTPVSAVEVNYHSKLLSK